MNKGVAGQAPVGLDTEILPFTPPLSPLKSNKFQGYIRYRCFASVSSCVENRAEANVSMILRLNVLLNTIKSLSYVLLIATFVLLANGCYYDIEEELYPSVTDSCDTANVTFSATVVPILEQQCYNCHSISSNTSGILLEGYDNVIVRVNDGSLEGSINYVSGFSPMPSGAPKLTDCNLAKISKWIDDGALDN